MVHLVITSWWPHPKGPEVQVKWNADISKFQDATKSFKYYFRSTKAGMKASGYFEVENDNLYNAYVTLLALATEFTQIEGYNFKIDIQHSLEETVELQAAQAAQATQS